MVLQVYVRNARLVHLHLTLCDGKPSHGQWVRKCDKFGIGDTQIKGHTNPWRKG